MYAVLYRSENSEYLREQFGFGKYTTIFDGKVSKYKKVCFRYAVKMNKHLKKFHIERYGHDVYFVGELKELK